MRGIDRRTFLGLGVGAVAWACGRDSDLGTEPSPSPGTGDLSLVTAMPPRDVMAVGDRRLAFALIDGEQPMVPRPADVRFLLAPPEGTGPGPLEPRVERIRLGVGGDADEAAGGGEVHNLAVVEHTLDSAGVWSAQVEVRGDGEPRRATAVFEVVAETPTPTVGDPAPAVPSPTVADPLGVDPICTRRPPCSLHEMTIADALSSGRPSAIIFATPAFCQTRTCGPVVDIAEHVQGSHEDVNFVHVEVWRSREAVGDYENGLVEAFAQWQLGTEPWIFFVDADGVIRERWVGAWGPDEMDRTTGALAAGDL